MGYYICLFKVLFHMAPQNLWNAQFVDEDLTANKILHTSIVFWNFHFWQIVWPQANLAYNVSEDRIWFWWHFKNEILCQTYHISFLNNTWLVGNKLKKKLFEKNRISWQTTRFTHLQESSPTCLSGVEIRFDT